MTQNWYNNKSAEPDAEAFAEAAKKMAPMQKPLQKDWQKSWCLSDGEKSANAEMCAEILC
jgi:hypothetical protein